MYEPLTESFPNIPLLRKIVEWVEEQDALPEAVREWDQASWYQEHGEFSCGTTMCVAGKVVIDAGWKPVDVDEDEDGTTSECTKDGQQSLIQDVAADLLGIDEDDAYSLFHLTNTAQDIRQRAERIAGERL